MEKAPRTSDLSPLESRRKIRVKAAAALNDVSEATFRRHYPHLIRKITTRRDAVELGDAIDLPPADKRKPR
jgi:DeoR/GlpR family transcriptional regulator of sugar metabolism